MINNLKALAVVLALAGLVFWAMRPACEKFMRPETFVRRRNIWFVLTIVAYVSPSFWSFALFELGLLLWACRKDANPISLFAMMSFTVPNASYYIPAPLVGQLFQISQFRLLAIAVLIPAIIRSFGGENRGRPKVLSILDVSLLCFLALQVGSYAPYESATALMRRSLLLFLDWFIVFYAFSRLKSLVEISDLVISFCVAAAIMAVIAFFEWAKGWLLYTGLQEVWGDPNVFAWLIRGDRLRAQAAAQGPLNLGYQLASALCLYMFCRTVVEKKLIDALIIGSLAVGLYATASRGPWLTAVIGLTTFAATRPDSMRRLAGAAAIALLAFALMYFTPLRESVIDRLPIIGTADQDTIEYRQQLADLSWRLIGENPFFGDPLFMLKMESLRQGQGIIDVVNGYLYTLLFTGWIGMIFQGIVFIGSLLSGSAAMLRLRTSGQPAAVLGSALVATFIATLFYIATAGYVTLSYLLAGLLVSFATVERGLASGRGRPSFNRDALKPAR